MSRTLSIVAAILMLTVICGCARKPMEPETATAVEQGPSETLSVFVSIPPLAQFVERVGGQHVSVHVLVPPGASPATYEPTPSQMATLDDADLYFRIGVPFEEALIPRIRASMPDLKVVDLREGIELREIEGGEGGGGTKDPHIWLDPMLVVTQAETIANALTEADPDHASVYSENLAAFKADLRELDEEIARTLRPLRGTQILVFHPAYGYFADRYGLEQVPIEFQGREPSPRRLEEIIAFARERKISAIFVQQQFSTHSAEAIAREIGASVVTLDPLARDWFGSMRQMAERLRAEAGAPDAG